MIYFIKAGNYIKVGYSKSEKSFKSRMSSYKTSCPFEVELISKIEGGVEEERNILNYFIKFHARGEWFNYDESIITFANNPYELPKSIYLKPLHKTNKIIDDNIEEMLKLYSEGISLRVICEQFKISRTRLTKYIPEELRRSKNEWFKINRREISPLNRPVIRKDTGEKFISLTDAARKTGCHRDSIWKVCNGQRKHTKGIVFEYADIIQFLEK